MSLPPNWREIVDPASGDSYFTNDATGETTWDDPRLVQLEPSSSRELVASQGKILLASSLRTMDPLSGATDPASDNEEEPFERPLSTRGSSTLRPRRQSLSADASKRQVFSIPPAKFCLDHRLLVPSSQSDDEAFVDLNMYRKSKEEWLLLNQAANLVLRMVRTGTRGLVKGASFEFFVANGAEPSMVITQSKKNLHPVFYLAASETADPMYTVSRKRGSSELRVFEGKGEEVGDCRFAALIGDDRCIIKIIDLKALGFHCGGTVSDIRQDKFVRVASGGDCALLFTIYVLLEHITGKTYCMKWEVENEMVVSDADVSSLLKIGG